MSSSTTLLVTICAVVAVACLFGGASAQSPDQACLFPKVGGNAYNFTGLFKDGPWEFMGSPSSSSSSSSTYTFSVCGTVECYNSEPNSAGCMTGGFSDEADGTSLGLLSTYAFAAHGTSEVVLTYTNGSRCDDGSSDDAHDIKYYSTEIKLACTPGLDPPIGSWIGEYECNYELILAGQAACAMSSSADSN